jgi:hypothetical protein
MEVFSREWEKWKNTDRDNVIRGICLRYEICMEARKSNTMNSAIQYRAIWGR